MTATAPPRSAAPAAPAVSPTRAATEPGRRAPLLPWLAGAALLSVALTTLPMRDPDVWWHLGVGRLIAQGGIPSSEPFSFAGAPNPWVGQQWLYEAGLYRLVSAGGAGLAMAVLGGVASLGLFLAALATRRGDRIPGAALGASIVLGALLAGDVLGVRGQVVTVTCFAATLLVVTRWREGRTRAVVALPPLLLVWANLHAGFVAGLALPLLAALVVALHRHWGGDEAARIRPLLLATGGAALATVVNPAGPHLWSYVASTFGNPTLTNGIVEWQSPNFHTFWPRAVAAAVVAVVVLWALARRADPLDVTLVGALLVAYLQAQRNVALLAVALVPILPRAAVAVWRERHRAARMPRRPRAAPPAWFGWAAVLLVGALTLVADVVPATRSDVTARSERQSFPAAAASYVDAHLHGRRLYSTYEWGGYLAWRLPWRAVWIYGESAVFGDARLRDYLTVHDLQKGWQDVLARNGMRLAVLPRAARETQALLEVGWTPVCLDATASAVVLAAGATPSPAAAPPADPATAPAC